MKHRCRIQPILNIEPNPVPNHVAIIMDGNGRWAQNRDQRRADGHRAGADAVRRTVRACRRLGVPALTLYAFSAQNWKRPPHEVSALMYLLRDFLISEREEILNNGIRLRSIGRVSELPDYVHQVLLPLEEESAENTEMTLTLALAYGGQEELADVCRTLAVRAVDGSLDPDDIDCEVVSANLPSAGVGPVDLLIRTAGEQRISNFLLWGIAYAEVVFFDKPWPEFDADDLHSALATYGSRERRFGLVPEPEAEKPAEASPPKSQSWLHNTVTRVLSAAVLIPVMLALLFWCPKPWWTAFCYVAVTIASFEMMQMKFPEHIASQVLGVFGSLGLLTSILFFEASSGLLPALLVHVVAALVVTLFDARMPEKAVTPETGLPPSNSFGATSGPSSTTSFDIESAAARMGWSIAGPIYIAGSLSTMALLHRLEQGGTWVILAMSFAFASDTAAYFVGKFAGQRKLYPAVSPNKTLEGSLGGILAAVLVSLFIRGLSLPEIPLVACIILATVAATLGQLGDLSISLLKRSTGRKDTGKIMPGHGGILDRVDALAVTSVVTWL
ncbi:MAG: polyprenyl diphosphate synthase, partial [Myxococcota bacterium]